MASCYLQLTQVQLSPQLQSVQVQFGLVQGVFFITGAHWHIAVVFMMNDLYD
jgi:hypothetical protein